MAEYHRDMRHERFAIIISTLETDPTTSPSMDEYIWRTHDSWTRVGQQRINRLKETQADMWNDCINDTMRQYKISDVGKEVHRHLFKIESSKFITCYDSKEGNITD